MEIKKDKFIDQLNAEKIMMLQFHAETLKHYITQMEKGIYSVIKDQDGNPLVSPASLTDQKSLDNRYDYFGICLDALDLEEEMLKSADQDIPEEDIIKKDYERIKREITLLMFHKDTLKALIHKKKGAIDIEISKSTATREGLDLRYEYFSLRNEAVRIQQELESKVSLINEYEKHVDRTLKECRVVKDIEIQVLVDQLTELPLSGKDKANATEWVNKWRTGKVVGLETRYDYYLGLKNFLAQLK